MNDPTIPILAYAFIGITTLVLSYATFMDNSNTKKDIPAASSLLPSFSSQTATPSIPVAQPISESPSTTNSMVQAISNPLGPSAPQLKIGGKTKKHHRKKHKKTKSKLPKH